MACGATYALVPFIDRKALGGVAGIVGAGGNVGAVAAGFLQKSLGSVQLTFMATNPAVSLPDADKVRAALARCELVVCSDIVERTDTNAYAHVLLPALGWGEKDGTVTSSERRISRQRPFLPAPGEARADWRAVCEVAKRMGFERGFDFAHPHEIFVEHAQLTAFRNREPLADGVPTARRQLQLGPLAKLDRRAYDALAPVQWPVTEQGAGTPRLFADGRFAHADGRAHMGQPTDGMIVAERL